MPTGSHVSLSCTEGLNASEMARDETNRYYIHMHIGMRICIHVWLRICIDMWAWLRTLAWAELIGFLWDLATLAGASMVFACRNLQNSLVTPALNQDPMSHELISWMSLPCRYQLDEHLQTDGLSMAWSIRGRSSSSLTRPWVIHQPHF